MFARDRVRAMPSHTTITGQGTYGLRNSADEKGVIGGMFESFDLNVRLDLVSFEALT